MKKNLFLLGSLIVVFLVFSCENPSNQEQFKQLNGYWSIQKVKQKNGDIKTYKANPTVDYIEVDSTGKGYRTKVQPKFDGSFKTSATIEKFKLKMENDSLRFHYKTKMDDWTETVLALDKDKFTVKNKRGLVYTYKRFESLEKQLKAHEHVKK